MWRGLGGAREAALVTVGVMRRSLQKPNTHIITHNLGSIIVYAPTAW